MSISVKLSRRRKKTTTNVPRKKTTRVQDPKKRARGDGKEAIDALKRESEAGCRELYFGRSGTGKTHTLLSRLDRSFFYPNGKVNKAAVKNRFFFMYSPSMEGNRAFKSFPHVAKLFKKPYGEHHRVMDENESRELKIKLQMLHKAKKRPYLILDDMGSHTFLKLAKADKNIVEFLSHQASHFQITLILLFQRFKMASPSLRENAEIINLYDTDRLEELKGWHKELFGRDDWNQFMDFWTTVFRKKHDHITIVRTDGGDKKIYKNDNFKTEIKFKPDN